MDGSKKSTDFKKITIGICAMKRKATSKPMRSIMAKMCEYYKDYLDFIIFPEEVVLGDPVEKWPVCDCLVGFHSTDFPLLKAIEYEKLRKPYVLNDLNRQFDLLDRRKVFKTLARAGIDLPRHCMVIRNEFGEVVGNELKEFNDHIEVNGMIFNKPFVEKPVSAEDHNVFIYYPSSVGGGSQRLFRKVNDRSSWYSPVSTVRLEGSFLYEEFIPADGTDVKVYAVGPYYAHAEARKAPGLDGKVERDADGKEVRYPVILSAREKTIARRVVLAFGQSVCGFDLLRANGRSYVCDVNGFSFVKTSTKYYEDTAKILGNMILRKLAGNIPIPWHIAIDEPPLVSTPSGKIMELRCVLAIIRHGDRTPKQKMKVTVTDARFFALFQKHDGMKKKEIKMKRPNQLIEVLGLIRQILSEHQKKREEFIRQERKDENGEYERFGISSKTYEKLEENIKIWDQMRTVLEMYGHFHGINRKVQLKYLKPKEHLSNKSLNIDLPSSGNSSDEQKIDDPKAVPTLQLILKWGGELTTAGILQAEALGKLFRTLYPGIRRTDGKECPEDTQGLGFLRLHSTFRHDLKIYASDEGRVQMTAAAFARGLLALEGELTPILANLVKSANTDGLLNDDYSARQFRNELKNYLHSVLQTDRDFTPTDYRNLNPSGLRSINNALEFIKNPRKMCHEIAGYVQRVCEIIRWHNMNNTDRTLYLNESWDLAERRWSKELREFRKLNKNEDGTCDFDISKIPDIYDNIKYDMEHNPELCINNEGEFERFYLSVKNMADIVVPQEYGISEESKISIAQRICTPLLAKIRNDLTRCLQTTNDTESVGESLTRLDPRASEGIATPYRHVRTRLYFTSESHIHTLMNLFRYGGLCSPTDKKWQRAINFLSGVTEFNYMTQLVLMVYEDSSKDIKDSQDRFHTELLFSPGLYPCFQTEKERIYETRTKQKMQQQHSQNSNSLDGNNRTNLKIKNNSGDTSEENTIGDVDLPSDLVSLNIDSTFLDDQKKFSSATVGECSDENGATKTSKLLRHSSIKTKNPEHPLRLSKNGNKETGDASNKVTVNEPSIQLLSENDEIQLKTDKSFEESDDENSVNLVVLDEVSNAAVSKKSFASPSLSPPLLLTPPRKRHATYERNSVTDSSSRIRDSDGSQSDGGNLGCKLDLVSSSVNSNELVVNAHPGRTYHSKQKMQKSMSDAVELSTRNRNNLVVESHEDHQTTVGHGRSDWVALAYEAKQIIKECRTEDDQTIREYIDEKKDECTQNVEAKCRRMPLLTSVFIHPNAEAKNDGTIKTQMIVDDTQKLEADKMDNQSNSRKSPDDGDQGIVFNTSLKKLSGASGSIIRDETFSKKARFPYRFKHHTVNFLTGESRCENRLISTSIISKKPNNNSVVLSTAVIGKSSSAPRLQTFKAGDAISVSEIKRFWPPLRSLETLHDTLKLVQIDQWLERMMKRSTPLPSPPKTPVQKETFDQHATLAQLTTKLKDACTELCKKKDPH